MKKRNLFLGRSAVIAALYAVLTILGAQFGFSYGGIQFRFSEALCVLPVFTASAVPGLTVGCVIANILSTVNPLDTVIGSAATLIAAILSRKCRNIRIKNLPLLSLFFPVIVNAVIIGAEIAFFTTDESFITAFFLNALSVGLSEMVVMYTLGAALVSFLNKNNRVRRLISD